MITPSSEPAVLRLSDGREVLLGTCEDAAIAFDQIHSVTGGSSGVGRWSRLFGLSLELKFPADELEGLKSEAKDFVAATELLLGEEATQLLHRLSSL